MTAPSPPSQKLTARLLPVLLMLAVSGFLAAGIAGLAWLRAARAPVGLDRLSSTDRQRLLADVRRVLPGVHEHAWFQTEIGYTLRPGARIEAWDDTFVPNALGYRTGPARKEPGVFRILFVGDSWTYGMGVREEESFPKVLERLANEHAGADQPVEAWTLALPGYNTINEIAAFDLWFGRLRPNAVVFVPSSNDNHSSPNVLPSGELFYGTAGGPDLFGHPHAYTYRPPWPVDSYVYQERWKIAWERLRRAEEKLSYYRIPSFLFFVAVWEPELVHRAVHDSALASPYAIVPPSLTVARRWINPGESGHGNPAANERYAQLLYRLLAPNLDWRPLPEDVVHPEIAGVAVFEQPPPEGEWRAESDRLVRRGGRQFVSERFEAGEEGSELQWAGPGDPRNGLVGRAVTVMVRPPAGTERLRVRLARLDEVRAFYPIEVDVGIPGPGGWSRRATVLSETGGDETVVEIEVPTELRAGRVLDVVVEASAVTAMGESEVAGSLRILSIASAR